MADFAADCMHEDEPLYSYGGRRQCMHCGMEFVWARTDNGVWAPHEWFRTDGGDALRQHLPNCRVVGRSDLADSRRAKA